MHSWTKNSLQGVCLLILASFLAAIPPAQGQDTSTVPKYEFRGAWIATVANLDWPKSRYNSTSDQKETLVQILDRLKAAGINAVIFQVRTEADALYASDIEPWSYWLTGEQGAAPDPFYDPLAFAIEEAHERGMELHAWFNPYRVDQGAAYVRADSHVTNTHPEWLMAFPGLTILNPGLPQVRDYSTRVVMDVVNRYDIDGVHFDDYFYPYPPDEMDQAGNRNKDQEAFEQYSRGFTDVENWRRDNVNIFVEQLFDSIQAVKPHIAFGISPFGIWKSGVPAGISGLSAYHTIYADAVAWVDSQHVDYLTPQLYWAFDGGQDYGTLAPWWAEQTSRNDRHLYPGLGVYKSDVATYWRVGYSADEVTRQVAFNQNHPDIMGSVFFRTENITLYNSQGITDSLKSNYYRFPALTPIMAWKDTTAPPAPVSPTYRWTGERNETVEIIWYRPEPSTGQAPVEFFAVYRVKSDEYPDPGVAMQDARNLQGFTRSTSFTDRPTLSDSSYYYFVTSVSRNSVESPATKTIALEARGVGSETPTEPDRFGLKGNQPNPFGERTTISFSLGQPGEVTLVVYDVLGREVGTLVDERLTGGDHTARFEAETLPSGVYFYRLQAGERAQTGKMVLVK